MEDSRAIEVTKRPFKLQFPMEPAAALTHLSSLLLDFEKEEILDFEKVWYLPVQ
jgi:hypothetical protein